MRDLKSELEVKEAKHFKRKAGDVFEGTFRSHHAQAPTDGLICVAAYAGVKNAALSQFYTTYRLHTVACLDV